MPHLSWNDFFNVFGLRRASFEANITNLNGNKGAIDLLWKGRLLVEHLFRLYEQLTAPLLPVTKTKRARTRQPAP